MNIVFFGDSLTRGTFGVGYVDKVAAGLRGHHFTISGINGDTSLNLYRRVTRDVIDQKPDGVFMMIGVNDAVSFAEPGARLYFRLVKQIRQGQVSPIAARENMRAIHSRLQAARIKTWVALPPVEYNPEVVSTLRKLNGFTAEVCAEMHVPVLDLMAKLTPANVPARAHMGLSTYASNFMTLLSGKSAYNRLRDSGGYTYSFDGFHLTEDGAQRFADLIVPFLRANGVA